MRPHVVGWRTLELPRAPTAVIAESAAAATLASATARRVRAGAALRAAVADDVLLVTGATEDLPWAPGVTYLGLDQDVLLPTTLAPDVPIDLLARAVRQQAGFGAMVQLALLPGRALAFSLSDDTVDPSWLDHRAVGETR